MRKHFLAASIAAVALIPSLAMAQQTCEQRSGNRVAGTVVGAGLGALLGSAIAGNSSNTAGTVAGGVIGGVIGNQASKGSRDCQHAYGYYDNDGRWHANNVASNEAVGYYDRGGNWIDGRPTGYYDSRGIWIANSAGVYGTNASYETRASTWDIDNRIARIGDRIDRARADGSLSYNEASRAQRTLRDIRKDENNRMRRGRLSDRDTAILQARLDRLQADVRMDRRD